MEKEEIKKAKCPGDCGAEYQWDWEQDTYVLVGGISQLGLFPYSVKLEQMQSKPGTEVWAWYCLYCGKIVGFSVIDDNGHFIYNHSD